MDRGFKCQKHLMNGEVTSVKTSQESSEIISIALKILSIFPGTHFLKKLMMFFFSLRQILSSVHSGCKLFAFSVLGLRGILTARTNFPLKCKLLTSQSFHLFYLLM